MNLEENSFEHYSLINPQPIIIMTQDNYNTLIESININYLLFLFIFSCFSTIIICIGKDKINYLAIPNSEIIEVKNNDIENNKISTV